MDDDVVVIRMQRSPGMRFDLSDFMPSEQMELALLALQESMTPSSRSTGS
jgi:hypothetical protein